METTALVLDVGTTEHLDNLVKAIRTKLWKVTLQPLRQIASATAQSRESATVIDEHLSENISLIYSQGKGVTTSRTLPDILIHSKLWTASKSSARQINGHKWETASAKYWYIKDDGSGYSLFVFSGQIETTYYELLRNQTVYLMNKWIGDSLLNLNLSLHAFIKFAEGLKLSTFEEAFIRHRLVIG